jgi:hypothetical protein
MTALERALLELELEWPETPDLAAAVLTRIEAAREDAHGAEASPAAPARGAAPGDARAPRRPFFAGWRRRVAVAVAALAVLGGGTLAVSPAARSTVSRWLGLNGVEIRKEKPTATPPVRSRLGETLDLGIPITPAQARRAGALFPSTLPRPDAAYLGPLVGGQRPVALVYAPRKGLPASKLTGVALIVQTFPRAGADVMVIKKMAGDVRFLQIGGAQAYWIGDRLHGFQYATPNGAGAFVPQRLADHTLLVESAGRLLRIEGPLSLDAATRIAESIH